MMKNRNIHLPSLLTIILIITALYIFTISFTFLPLDDTDIIQSRLSYLMNFRNILDIFTTPLYKDFVTSLYRPFLYLTFMVDAILGGGSPSVFHLSNMLFHIISSLLLYEFLSHFIPAPKILFGLTFIYAIHPIHVHAVAWISGRNDILLAIDLLLIFITFRYSLQYRKHRYYIYHFFLLFISFFIKETAVVIPVLLVIYAVWISPKSDNLTVFIPGWILISGFALLIRSFVVTGNLPLTFTGLMDTSLQFSIIFTNYLGKLFIPIHYSVLPTTRDMGILPGLIVLITLSTIGFAVDKKNKKLFWFGIVWFILFLSPTILWGIWSRIDEFYEHRLYIPAIGLLLSVSQLKWRLLSSISTIVKTFVIVGMSIILIIMSFERMIKYRDPISFTDAAVLESPSLARSHSIRGYEYQNIGDYQKALSEFEMAIKIKPNIAWVYSNCGQIQLNMKNYNHAIELFTIAVQMNPKDGNAYFNRAIVYVIVEQLPAAIEDFSEAIQLVPDNADYFYNRGLAYETMGDNLKAIEDFQSAQSLLPGDELLIEKIESIKSENSLYQ